LLQFPRQHCSWKPPWMTEFGKCSAAAFLTAKRFVNPRAACGAPVLNGWLGGIGIQVSDRYKALFGFDVRVPCDLCPSRKVGAKHGGKVLRSSGRGLHAKFGELVFHFRIREYPVQICIEFVHDCPWCFRWQEKRNPPRELASGNALLRQCGHVR